jgi:hypothetical protein
MACHHCGVEGPTRYTEFQQNIGMLFARRTLSIEAELCRPCMGMYFRSFTLTTFFLGWWGIISFFMTPYILFKNVVEYLRCRSLPEPGLSATNVPLERPAVNARDILVIKLVYGIVAWSIVLGLLAYNQVGFIEKYAPWLNAGLHGGEITDDSDSEYAMVRIQKDISALESDIKADNWPAMRTAFLGRENYLTDLVSQNNSLQHRLAAERQQNAGATDPCERWALEEFGPTMHTYTDAVKEFFALVKNTPEMNADSNAIFKSSSASHSHALKELNLAFDDAHRHCSK